MRAETGETRQEVLQPPVLLRCTSGEVSDVAFKVSLLEPMEVAGVNRVRRRMAELGHDLKEAEDAVVAEAALIIRELQPLYESA